MEVERALSRSRSRSESEKKLYQKNFNYLESLEGNERIEEILSKSRRNESPYRRKWFTITYFLYIIKFLSLKYSHE